MYMNSNCGNESYAKGYILTMDMIFGIAIIIAVISFSSAMFTGSETGVVSDISSLRTATDIIAVLDYDGVFTQSTSVIETKLNETLPSNIQMSLTIEKYNENMTFLGTTAFFEPITDEYLGGKWISLQFDSGSAVYRVIKYRVKFK